MSNTNTGGSAFPVLHDSFAGVVSQGMTMRDYFAAKALQGLLAGLDGDMSNRQWMAEKAYMFADAMLKEREA